MPVGRAEPCKGSQQVGNGTQFIQPWCVALSSVVMASLIEDSLNSAISSPSPAPCSNTQTVSQHGEATVFCVGFFSASYLSIFIFGWNRRQK